jgi:carbonic anhydrase
MSDPLLERSQAQRAEFFERERDLLASLASSGQFPQAMFIGCNDSRVVPESLMGARPGDLFVVRVLANIVPPYGTGQNAVGAAAEYAVRSLNIEHFIICGHLDCGGILALDTGVDMATEPTLANWIEFARPAQTHVDAQGLMGHERHQAIVEANVLLQMENLRTYPAVQSALAGNRLELHGWVYDLVNCQLRFYDANQGRFEIFSPTLSEATA